MFTGIIEQTGIVQDVQTQGSNVSFWISSPLSTELKIDQSLSHNGVCLTVEEINDERYLGQSHHPGGNRDRRVPLKPS